LSEREGISVAIVGGGIIRGNSEGPGQRGVDDRCLVEEQQFRRALLLLVQSKDLGAGRPVSR
jgi:hypothetical protein